MNDEQRAFLKALWLVNAELHDWAAARFREGASLSDVKSEIRAAAKIAGRN